MLGNAETAVLVPLYIITLAISLEVKYPLSFVRCEVFVGTLKLAVPLVTVIGLWVPAVVIIPVIVPPPKSPISSKVAN